MLELIYKDEYNQHNIVKKANDFETLVTTAKTLVTESNMNNALTNEEQQRDWESYFVEFVNEDGEVLDDVFYAGLKGHSYHKVLFVKDDVVTEEDIENVDGEPRFYIGMVQPDRSKPSEPIYAKVSNRSRDGEGMYGRFENVELNTFDNALLQDKSVYYIRPQK